MVQASVLPNACAIVSAGSSSSNSSSTGTAITVPAPSGTAVGDVVIVVVHGNGQTTINDQNGNTPFTKDLNDYQPNPSSGMTVSIFSRRVQFGDPSTYNFTMGASARWSAVAIAFQNPDPNTVYDVAPSTSNVSSSDCPPCSSSITVPSITTVNDGSIQVLVGLVDGSSGSVVSGPAGYTLQQSTTPQAIGLYTKVISPPGSTGAQTIAFDHSDGVIGLTFAVKNNGTAVTDSQPPSVPANLSATPVSSSQINLNWTASTDNVGVTGYDIYRSGVKVGTSGSNSYSDSNLSPGTAYTYTVSAFDAAGNNSSQSAPASAATLAAPASNGIVSPLHVNSANPNYFTDASGRAILLTGSHTWDSFQDTDQSSTPAPVDFTAYVNFLKSHNHNCTILWKKDLPTYCNWGAGGTWHMAPHPWLRTGGSAGTQMASDGLPAFDFTQFNQAYFDRLRGRVIELQTNGIYAIVELFDGLGLVNNRCANDGYPFSAGNNINGIDDGGGANSMTMSGTNAITAIQDAYVKKVIDTLNDLPNVLWEISEEAPDNSTWWQGHMIGLIHSYEAAKAVQHPVGYPTLNVNAPNDQGLYNSDAEWVAPSVKFSPSSSCGSGTPSCKVNINDSDHSYFGMWNDSAQVNRNYVWENFANGNQVIFMDPYLIYWASGNRNLPANPVNGVGSAPDPRWNNFRDNMGYALAYANKMNLVKMTAQGNLASTGYVLANAAAVGAEYLVYAPNGGSFTVNLSSSPNRPLSVEWLNPTTGAITSAGSLTGGSSSQSFTPPFGGDAVLYLADKDTTPPTAPTNLAATAVSSSQINLSWSASTDNVGVIGYYVERQDPGSTNFAQIGSAAGTSFNDTNLASGSTYSYRVRATDAAGNPSGYSATASATTQAGDTQPPTVPTNLVATAVSASQINLSWSASTDNVGVTGYYVERQNPGSTNFGQIASVTGTSFNDTNLVSGSSYSYRVRATDAAGNLSAYSAVAAASTQTGASGLVAAYSFNEGGGATTADSSGNGNTGTLVNASWTAAGKNGGAVSFDGATSYIDLGNPTSLQLTGSMTLEAWVFATGNPPDDGQVIAKSDNVGGWQLKTTPDTGVETFGVAISPNGTAHVQRYSKTVRALNTWYHVAGVYDANARTLDIYVNGLLDNGSLRGTVAGSQIDLPQNTMIGRRSGGFYFQGTIDEVRVYNTALTATQIQNDMNGSIANAAPALVAEPAALIPVPLEAPALNPDGTFSFTFNTRPGYVYTVQSASGLDPSGWVTVTNIPGTGLDMKAADVILPTPGRFYRVLSH